MMIAKRHLACDDPSARGYLAEEAAWVGSPRDSDDWTRGRIDARAAGDPRRFLPPPRAPDRTAIRQSVNGSVVQRHDRVRRRHRVERLAQASGRKRPRIFEVLAYDDDEIPVPVQGKVLKAIVEHVDRAAEVVLGQTSGKIAAGRREHGDAVEAPREHQRLVAGTVEIRANAVGIAHDDHAIPRVAPGVAAAQNRGPFAHLAQARRDQRGQRRLRPAADRDIADADDRAPKVALQVWTALVIAA